MWRRAETAHHPLPVPSCSFVAYGLPRQTWVLAESKHLSQTQDFHCGLQARADIRYKVWNIAVASTFVPRLRTLHPFLPTLAISSSF